MQKKTFEEIMEEDDTVYDFSDNSNNIIDDIENDTNSIKEDEEGNRFLFND